MSASHSVIATLCQVRAPRLQSGSRDRRGVDVERESWDNHIHMYVDVPSFLCNESTCTCIHLDVCTCTCTVYRGSLYDAILMYNIILVYVHVHTCIHTYTCIFKEVSHQIHVKRLNCVAWNSWLQHSAYIHVHNITHSLVIEFVSLTDMEYQELVSAVRREHLQSTVPQKIATLVDLPHNCVRPLHTADREK